MCHANLPSVDVTPLSLDVNQILLEVDRFTLDVNVPSRGS